MPTAGSTTQKSIGQSFAQLRGRGIGLVPFIPAGYPDLATTAALLKELDGVGVAAIEIGFPFSDPIADGPTIQQAFTTALSHHLKVSEIFKTVASVSRELSSPLVAMVSFSIVFRYGPERFFSDARDAGFSAILIPDLPPPQAEKTCQLVRKASLDTILLVAPTTTEQRRKEIIKLTSGFVYYLSFSGITGARDQLPHDISQNVQDLKSMTDLPICVGFGISKPRHLVELAQFADGAVVGSALVRTLSDSLSSGPLGTAKAVGQYCRTLLANSHS
jgi:tryptophan synthase alpha chain